MTATRAEAAPASAQALRESVARSCRILAHQGHDHLCFGHVSVRDPAGSGLLVKVAGLGLEEVRADDVAATDSAGAAIEPGVQLHDEMPLHTEIYRARPDVGAIVHTHPSTVAILSLFEQSLLITSQDAVPFRNRLAFYPSSDLVTTVEQGRELAATLGGGRAAVLRAHGLVAVGADLAEATVNAVLLERAMRTNLAASALGRPEPIGAADLDALERRFEHDRDRRIERLWDYLVRTLERAGG